jgi:CheY-like chemotaxis protein
MSEPMILMTYHHQDEAEKGILLEKLGKIEHGKRIETWSEARIDNQGNWQPALNRALGEARIALLLITADYLNSAFISQPAVAGLLQRHSAAGLPIIPVLVRPCAWRVVAWLHQLNVYPQDGTPVWHSSGGDVEGVLTGLAEMVEAKIKATAGEKRELRKGPVLQAGRERLPASAQKPFDKTKRVLVIEDEAGWQRRLDRILGEINCTSVSAENYDQALDLLNTTDFDLVIVDLNLDKSTGYADGLELMPRIRDQFGGRVPVIVLTGTGGLEEQRRAFKDYHVYDFIQKAKLDFTELQRLVIQAIGRNNGQGSHWL